MVSSVTMQIVHRACEEAIPRTRAHGGRRPSYWWTNEIAALRKKCLKLRRAAQRGRKNDRDFALRSADYRTAKKSLGQTIKTSKRRCWDRLRDDLNSDPWGLGYKIVMRKLEAFTNRYLEVMLDTELTFWDRIRKGGPHSCVRRLLLCTAESIMLYRADIWADAMRYEKYFSLHKKKKKKLYIVFNRRIMFDLHYATNNNVFMFSKNSLILSACRPEELGIYGSKS